MVSPPNSGFDGADRPGAAGPLERTAFGQFLVAARHRSERSLEDIAASTKVAPRLLEALERGDVEQLPAGVYRRAIVKNYAIAIGLNPDTALERFDRTFSPASTDRRGHRAVASAPHEPGRPAHMGRRRFAILAAALVAVVVAGVTLPTLLKSERQETGLAITGAQPASFTHEPSAIDPAATASTGQTPTIGTQSAESLEPEQTTAIPSAPNLVITSSPSGARVTVNGIGWGVTPITIRNLPPGQKTIRVTKDGYVGSETTVQFGLTDGDAAVRLTLQPLD